MTSLINWSAKDHSLADADCLQKTSGHHHHSPWRAVSEYAADFTLKGSGTAAKLGAKFAGERSQTSIADFEADFCYAALRGEHLAGAVHAQASEKIMWRLAESGTEETMEMKF